MIPQKQKTLRWVKYPQGLSAVFFERRGVGGMGLPLKSTLSTYRDRPNVEVTEVTKWSGKEPKRIRGQLEPNGRIRLLLG
jgi:hypothetical protein